VIGFYSIPDAIENTSYLVGVKNLLVYTT